MDNAHQHFIELRKEYIEKRFGRLNNEQREAVFWTDGPLLILAGAGSGKTTVLVNRIANLIMFGKAYNSEKIYGNVNEETINKLQQCIDQNKGAGPDLAPLLAVDTVRPYNILAITFTNKAAGELKARLSNLLGEDIGGDVNASTFHSACVRILRRESEKLGFTKSFTIYDSDDQLRVMKEIYKALNIDDRFLQPRACLSAIGRLKDQMQSPVDAAEDASDTRAKLVAQVYAEYAKRCKNAGAMDFDDLIYFTVRLLQENKEVHEFYQNRFKYILVDEYQDTSVAQFQLVNLLCSDNNNICVVGDDDQSIYRFRGATIENILSFEKRFSGTKVIRLEQNYRSTSCILDVANSVIKNNAGRKGKTLWTANEGGKQVEHYSALDENDEAAHIAEVIGRHVKEGAKLHEHAVLYRMNAQSSPVENYFTRAGIPYKIIGGLRFYDRKEIRDMHAYMSIVANPLDDLRLKRIINEPARKIGATTVEKMAEIAAGLGVGMLEVVRDAENYPQLSRAANAIKGFYQIYLNLEQAARQFPIDEFAAQIQEITGYEAMLKAMGDEGLTRLENLGQFVSNVKTYRDMHGEEATIEGYLEEVALIADIDSYDGSEDAVVMMTLHSAKGLEFPYVFMVGLEEGVFPSDLSKWKPEEVEEERRLCYVGITRAREELVLSSAASRMLYGQTRRNQPSRFIEEIDQEILDSQTSPTIAAQAQNNYIKYGASARGAGYGGAPKSGYLDSSYNREPSPVSSASRLQPSFGLQKTASPKKAGNEGVEFNTGDKVEHKVFGRGVVIKVTPVAGDSIVEIQFETHGTKKTMANFAPLKKI